MIDLYHVIDSEKLRILSLQADCPFTTPEPFSVAQSRGTDLAEWLG
jgi:hypothetical protein